MFDTYSLIESIGFGRKSRLILPLVVRSIAFMYDCACRARQESQIKAFYNLLQMRCKSCDLLAMPWGYGYIISSKLLPITESMTCRAQPMKPISFWCSRSTLF